MSLVGYFYKKEYLPGYTGHVPKKNDMFGLTAGEVNRVLVSRGGSCDATSQSLGRTSRHLTCSPALDALRYGNKSRKAANWIGGPTHDTHSQHIPGYTGHVPGVISENFFSKSFAKTTSTAINGQFPRGADFPTHHRYVSQNAREYSPDNFRRFVEKGTWNLSKKDYEDYTSTINDENTKTRTRLLPKNKAALETMRSHTSMGGPRFRNGVGSTVETMPMKEYMSVPNGGTLLNEEGSSPACLFVQEPPAIRPGKKIYLKQDKFKPKLLESKILERTDFMRLSDGFKKAFTDDLRDQDIKIPISGYAGHKRGDRSQNFFGKTYRECAIQSKKFERVQKKKY